ncbi:MAG: nicotinate-nucleotide adenylyltransferase [Alphaproteobacteria bacterium]|nr:MAG: nicotinate-nucleotide adenylyltransferase [Alphaproteobacteria bacterium]
MLGGSFNPAHDGHLAITLTALSRLRLDRVWWLVSPQNPLKPRTDMAPLAERVAGARALARHPRIVVGAIEALLGTVYTVDTATALIRRFPCVHFVWLMGADNLEQVTRWKDWPQLFETLPVAVFDRPSYSLRALAAPAAQRFSRQRLAESMAGRLAGMTPPAWVFIHNRLNPQSSTRIRAARRRRRGCGGDCASHLRGE